jgi:hypothetical protein
MERIPLLKKILFYLRTDAFRKIQRVHLAIKRSFSHGEFTTPKYVIIERFFSEGKDERKGLLSWSGPG